MSKFIGQIGKRISINVKIIQKLYRINWKSKNNIIRYLYILQDENKNIITISTPSSAFMVGEKWKLVGRVKQHNMFNHQAQTQVSRWEMSCNPKEK